jgi:hypothetical protein
MFLINVTGIKVFVCSVRAICSRPFTANARFHFQASPCIIYGKSDAKTCFPLGSLGFPCHYNSTIVSYQLFHPLSTLCSLVYSVRKLFANPVLRLGVMDDFRLPIGS